MKELFRKSQPKQESIPVDNLLNKKELSFHETKDVVEREINRRKQELGDEREYPEINYYIDNDKSSVGFALDNDADLFSIMSLLSIRLGSIKFRSYMRGFYKLSVDDLDIDLMNEQIFEQPKTIKFSNDKNFKSEQIEAIVETYIASVPKKVKEDTSDPIKELSDLGVKVFQENVSAGWDSLAGYETAKKLVKETVIYPLEQSQVYDDIARKTRKNYEVNRPKAVLFYGPPGTGKTTMARIIAGEVKAGLIYVPVESIMTKWYGESERNLAEIFKQAARLGDSLIFLDEIDSLATSRDSNIHEATRRVLSVLLREIDGFEVGKKTMVIGATNRKDDLDPALLSRFDTQIEFDLPNSGERKDIFATYAQHLSQEELGSLADNSEGLSGRDIRKLCESTERSWALVLISKEVESTELPGLDRYLTKLTKK